MFTLADMFYDFTNSVLLQTVIFVHNYLNYNRLDYGEKGRYLGSNEINIKIRKYDNGKSHTQSIIFMDVEPKADNDILFQLGLKSIDDLRSWYGEAWGVWENKRNYLQTSNKGLFLWHVISYLLHIKNLPFFENRIVEITII
ncbi:hypothetical protein OSB04_006207 [Centaurea solstitialis]|uniref:Uncharacterized protein n=1 Tax=Centaurea solstitialis TaxID=347529 RepID=A0AA38WHG3_9ASTR|nr:hypothetical protein OSB04_006207 [Centaurea solstitialis]